MLVPRLHHLRTCKCGVATFKGNQITSPAFTMSKAYTRVNHREQRGSTASPPIYSLAQVVDNFMEARLIVFG